MSKRSQRKLGLWWVSTEDGDEDWFVVAYDMVSAEEFFADEEGYDPEDPCAELVTSVPTSMVSEMSPPCWPSDEQLVAMGGKRLPTQSDGLEAMRKAMGSGGRVFQFGDEIYSEGDIVRNVAPRGLGETDAN